MLNSIVFFSKSEIINRTVNFLDSSSFNDTAIIDLVNIVSKLIPNVNIYFDRPEYELAFLLNKLSKEKIIEVLNSFCIERNIVLFPLIDTPLSYNLSKVTKKKLIGCLTKKDGYSPFFWYGDLKEFDYVKNYCKFDTFTCNESNENCYEYYHKNRLFRNPIYSSDMFFHDTNLPFQTAGDKYILEFLESVFSPEVRNDSTNWKSVLLKINILLVQDGYILSENSRISGQTIYKYKKIEEALTIPQSAKRIAFSFNTNYISQQRQLIESNIDNNPYVSIGKSKELIESSLKYILSCKEVPYSNYEDLLKLNKKVTRILKIDVQSNPYASEKINGAKHIFSGLLNIVKGMSELRNQNGDGHGFHPNHFIIPSRYARLAASASITYVAFLKESFEEIQKNK